MRLTATSQATQILAAGAPGPYTMINYDIANEIYWDTDSGCNPETSTPLDPLATVVLAAGPVWVITSGPAVVMYLVQGATSWTPSPAKVSASISALGLARDTTVAEVTTTLGAPAQDSTVHGVTTVLGAPAQDSSVHGVTTALGAPAQDGSVQALHSGQPIATEIAGKGAPLLRLGSSLGHGTASLAHGGVATLLSGVALTQLAFQMFIQLSYSGASGTVPFGLLQFTWQDAATGNIIGYDDFAVPVGPNGTPTLVMITGPLLGDELTLALNNLDPADSVTYTWSLSQTSHVWTRIRMLEPFATAVPGFTRPGTNGAIGNLASMDPTVNAGASAQRLASCWAGRAQLIVDNTGQANQCTVQLLDPEGSGANTLYSMSGTGSLATAIVAAGQPLTQEVTLPNGPVVIKVTNNGASGSIAPTIGLTKTEY